MSDYLRYFKPGGTYFFTIVAYRRRPILTSNNGRKFLRDAIATIRKCYPFEIVATVLLPDHWHLVMQLPRNDSDFSIRLKRIKEEFSQKWLGKGLPEARVTPSQKRRGVRGIWQPRFWEHLIEDDEDLARCVDYIHWNPRKHELVDNVRDWKWSSFHRFVKLGEYDLDWGSSIPKAIKARLKQNWGE